MGSFQKRQSGSFLVKQGRGTRVVVGPGASGGDAAAVAAAASAASSASSAASAAAAATAAAGLVGAPAGAAIDAHITSGASPAVKKGDLVLNARDYGATGNGTANDNAAIQSALDAAATSGGGVVYLAPGTYKVTGLLMPSNVTLSGVNSGGQVGGATKLLYAGTAGGTVIGPKAPTTDTVNVGLTGVQVNGAGLADVCVSFYRTSYSRLRDCAIYGAQAGTGVGVLYDSNVSNQCYFNAADGNKVDGCPVGVRYTRGANANRWEGGKIGNGAIGMEFLTLSAGNLVSGTDLETASVKHIYVAAASNVFVGLHMEVAPLGFDITAAGNGTRRFGTTFATNVTTWVTDASTQAGSLDEITSDTYRMQVGATRVDSKTLSTTTQVDVDPKPFTGTASAILNFFRNITTSGARQINLYKGDGTSTTAFTFNLATGDITSLSNKRIDGTWGYTETVGLAPPVSGAQVAGSIVRNRAPAVGSPKAWVCTVSGTPGTWVSTGNL